MTRVVEIVECGVIDHMPLYYLLRSMVLFLPNCTMHVVHPLPPNLRDRLHSLLLQSESLVWYTHPWRAEPQRHTVDIVVCVRVCCILLIGTWIMATTEKKVVKTKLQQHYAIIIHVRINWLDFQAKALFARFAHLDGHCWKSRIQ